MPRGGARAGAGRKRTADKYASKINAAEKRIADRLPQLIDNLLYLANGGYEIGSETREPAGLVFAKGDGSVQPMQDLHPNLFAGDPPGERLFPSLPPDELVVTKRVVSIAAPDRAANQYLIDRILGKTIAPLEVSGPGGDPIVFSLHLGDAEPTG